MTGDVHSQLSSHSEAIACFEEILASRPTEIGVLVSLGRTLVAQAREQTVSGYHARAEASLLGALDATWTVLDSSPGFGALAWKSVGDACIYLAQLVHSFDGGKVSAAVGPFAQRLAADDQAGQSSVADVVSARQIGKAPGAADATYLLKLAVCAFARRDNLLMGDEKLAAASLHDIAIALHHLAGSLAYADKELRSTCVRQATAYVRSALRFRPKDEQLWTTLGTIVFESSPNLSQHAFIMALEINPKVGPNSLPLPGRLASGELTAALLPFPPSPQNPVVWSNLGFLYLAAEDLDLAAQAFLRSQTLDPDCALAWMGQGLLALQGKATHEASLMFEHAADLSSNSLVRLLPRHPALRRARADLLARPSSFSSRRTSSSPSRPTRSSPQARRGRPTRRSTARLSCSSGTPTSARRTRRRSTCTRSSRSGSVRTRRPSPSSRAALPCSRPRTRSRKTRSSSASLRRPRPTSDGCSSPSATMRPPSRRLAARSASSRPTTRRPRRRRSGRTPTLATVSRTTGRGTSMRRSSRSSRLWTSSTPGRSARPRTRLPCYSRRRSGTRGATRRRRRPRARCSIRASLAPDLSDRFARRSAC